MFFTLSLGFGALIAFASYMPLHNQVMHDAYTVVFINCGTSLFAGIVVFSILGYREHVTGIPATEVCYSCYQCLQTQSCLRFFITYCDAWWSTKVTISVESSISKNCFCILQLLFIMSCHVSCHTYNLVYCSQDYSCIFEWTEVFNFLRLIIDLEIEQKC